MIKRLLLPMSILFLFCACKARKTPLNAEIANHLLFKVGSYWIFSDSSGTAYDSIYVSDYSDRYTSETTMPHIPPLLKQVVDIKLKKAGDTATFMSMAYEYARVNLDVYNGAIDNNYYFLSYEYPTTFTFDTITINSVGYKHIKMLTYTPECTLYFAEDIGPVLLHYNYNNAPYQRQLLRSHIVF